MPQTVAVHVGHAEPGQPAGVPGGEHRDHVRVLELCRQKHFAPEALDRDTGQQFRRQDLDHHPPVERLLHRQIGAGHAPAPQLALERVRARQRRLKPATQLVHYSLIRGCENMRVGAPKGQRRYDCGCGVRS
jgi:hypothetical protein